MPTPALSRAAFAELHDGAVHIAERHAIHHRATRKCRMFIFFLHGARIAQKEIEKKMPMPLAFSHAA